MYWFLVLIVFLASTNSLPTKATLEDADRIIFPKDRNTSVTRIYGGNEAGKNDFRYQVALYLKKERSLGICGGSLIAQDVVLTAAHCLKNVDEVYVIYAHHNNPDYNKVLDNTEENVLKTTMFKVHEEYDENNSRNDIALVYLPEKIAFNEHVTSISLDKGTNKHEGEQATVTGWGITSQGESLQFGRGLRYVQDEIISNEKCKSATTQYNSRIKDSHICLSNEKSKGPCSGDSGGPLVIGNVQVGIVSFGSVLCTPTIPSVFTRVSYFRDWIDTNSDEDHKGSPSAAVTFNPNYFFLLLIVGLMKKY